MSTRQTILDKVEKQFREAARVWSEESLEEFMEYFCNSPHTTLSFIDLRTKVRKSAVGKNRVKDTLTLRHRFGPGHINYTLEHVTLIRGAIHVYGFYKLTETAATHVGGQHFEMVLINERGAWRILHLMEHPCNK